MPERVPSLPEFLRDLTRNLIGEPEFSPLEVSARAGVEIELARRLWRALGLPPIPDDQKVFAHADVEILRNVRTILEQGVVDASVQLQMTRVIGQALARVAEAQVSVATVVEPIIVGAGNSAEIITRVKQLVDLLESFLGYTWRRHLLAAVWRHATAASVLGDEEKKVAVGFADMVGFTELSQELEARELADVVDRFEALVYEHVPEQGGRVVKMIGDEVMFAADDIRAAAEIALGLVQATRNDSPLPQLRVGVAWGPVLAWEGDLFGPIVNLASRLVNAARPGTVLVSEGAAELLAELDVTVRPIPALRLKGIGRVHASVLRRKTSDDR